MIFEGMFWKFLLVYTLSSQFGICDGTRVLGLGNLGREAALA
jgi:hypothetical protein